MKSSSVFLNSLLHFYSASIFFSGTSLLFSLLTSSKPFILSFFGTSISGDGSMLESRIITAQSDDNFIERMRFENEIISDIDSARMKLESIQPAFTIRCLITAILQIAFLRGATGKAPKF